VFQFGTGIGDNKPPIYLNNFIITNFGPGLCLDIGVRHATQRQSHSGAECGCQAVRTLSVNGALSLEPMEPVTVYLEGVQFAFLLIKQDFTHEDGLTGIQYLVTSDTTLTGNGIAAIYQKRWKVEPYHKTLKQNASLEKSPTHTVTTQTNHYFATLCGYIQLAPLTCVERVKVTHDSITLP